MAAGTTPGTRRRTVATRKDMAETMRLALEEGLTQDQIAARQGITQGAVSKRINKLLAEHSYSGAEEWRKMDGLRLEHERAEIKAIIRRQADDEMKLKGYDRLLRYSDRLAKLYGADLPVKVDMTVTEVSEAERELQEIINEARAKTAAEEARIRSGA